MERYEKNRMELMTTGRDGGRHLTNQELMYYYIGTSGRNGCF